MKTILTFVFFFPFLFGPASIRGNTPGDTDKQKILNLATTYVGLLQTTINQKLKNYLGDMSNCFEDPIKNDHTYDLSDKVRKTFILAYLSDAQKASNIESIEIEIEDIELLDCTYFDPKTSQTYTYVKVPKTMIWSNNDKTSYVNYLSVNITNSTYFIENVFDDSAITHERYLSPCLNTKLDTEKQRELSNQIDILYNQVSSLYSEKKYLEAIQIVETILLLNPEYQKAKDAKEAIIDLIDVSVIENNLQQLLLDKDVNGALKNLNIAKKYTIGNETNHTEWELKIHQTEKKLEQELYFQKAGYFYGNQMYQQALPILLQLKAEGFKHPRLDERINICNESDPQLIQKRIKAAYDAAVASKKNYNTTFKTYYKYENSGYLKGTNFHFMCLMMLDNGNKRLLREMGITPNQSKNLVIKYFFKAREMGIDNRDIETQIFTKNFIKKWKN